MPDGTPVPYEIKELSAQHKQALSLIAQGVDRGTIAKVCDYTPEYISWLKRMPICQTYIKQMQEKVDLRLELMYEASVDAIADTLTMGNGEERLKAARLQLEATGRLGKGNRQQNDDGKDKLEKLAERLLGLQSKVRSRTLDGESTVVEDAQPIG